MAIPQLTPEQRKEALKKAQIARTKRAAIKADLKSGKATIKNVLAQGAKDDIIGRMKVIDLISALPGYGKAKAAKVMKECKIADSRRIKGLGDVQRETLLIKLG
ncbi:MAG: integration host factor [Eggerthellaceae bacterium]|nr:integration host factor [Eggerthellaceae bacterium]